MTRGNGQSKQPYSWTSAHTWKEADESREEMMTVPTHAPLAMTYRPEPDRGYLILDMYGLTPYLKWWLSNNLSSQAPYAGLQHTMYVVEDIYTILRATDENLNQRDMEIALLAALFHDFNHSMGAFPDNVNIARALSGWKQAYEQVPVLFGMRDRMMPHEDYDRVIKLIEVTEFILPQGFTREPDNLLEKALRDADLFTIFHIFDNRGKNLYHGLMREVNYARQLRGIPIFDVEQFSIMVENFFRSATFYTDYARSVSAQCLEMCLIELRRYLLR